MKFVYRLGAAPVPITPLIKNTHMEVRLTVVYKDEVPVLKVLEFIDGRAPTVTYLPEIELFNKLHVYIVKHVTKYLAEILKYHNERNKDWEHRNG